MKTITLLFCLQSSMMFAQDITGLWSGYLKMSATQLRYELTISDNGKNLSGFSMIVFINDSVENIGIKTARIKQKGKEIFFEDEDLVYDNYTTAARRSKLIGSLLLEFKDTLMILKGTFRTRSLDFRDNRTYSGEIYLQKENDGTTSKILPRLEELNLMQTLSFINPPLKRIMNISRPVADNQVTKNSTSFLPINVTPQIAIEKIPNKPVNNMPTVAINKTSNESVTTTPAVVNKKTSNEPIKTTPEIANKKTSNESINTTSQVAIKKASNEPIRTTPEVASKKTSNESINTTPEVANKKISNESINTTTADVIKKTSNESVNTTTADVIKKISNEPISAKPHIVARKTEKIQDIFFYSDSLVLSLFDNGTVDGDTVSLLLNGKIIADKIGLGSKAYKVVVPVIVNPGDSLQLVMYADNLGSIPPNTGLLVIEEGSERHEIRFAGDMQKSSSIILRKRTK